MDAQQPDRPPAPARRPVHMVGALAAVLLGGLSLWQALGQGVGSLGRPGAGLWPAILASALVVAGIALAVLEHRGSQVVLDADAGSHRRPLYGFLGLVGYVVVFTTLGFLPATASLLLFWLRGLAGERWAVAVPVVILATAAFYVVFVVLLGVPVPRSSLLVGS